MVDDWRKIPGNEFAFERVQDHLMKGNALAFVGAGASAGLYPLWVELIRLIADKAVQSGRADEDDRSAWLKNFADYPDQVVRSLKAAQGDGIYAQTLREIFSPKIGKDGNRFTPVHSAILRLPFKGVITTNFDSGLVEARSKLRQDSLATGFGTWKDQDTVELWHNGDIFRDQPCPILFAHGIYERSDTIVLGVGEYREAYRNGAFRRLFLNLWETAQMIFIGFSFSDQWVKFVANEVLTTPAGRVHAPRHAALLGLREDETYVPFMRNFFVNQYDAEPLFYRITKKPDGSENHDELRLILEALASHSADRPPLIPAILTDLPDRGRTETKAAQHWTHATTEDDHFTGRVEAIRTLDRWSGDADVRMIAITGMGGLGKTSLLAHWLKAQHGNHSRISDGLFFWSIYQDRSVKALIRAFVRFAVNEMKISMPRGAEPGEMVLEALRRKPIILAIDGLELLQEGPATADYGALLEDNLRELLNSACRLNHRSLIVLTSRFPLSDLMDYLGRGFRALNLEHLSPDEGATLLAACGVGGTAHEKLAVSRRLNGHPLGLRIFALALARTTNGDPSYLLGQIFDAPGLVDSDPLDRKLKRLLTFYEHALPRNQVALLGIVSLFRSPALLQTILTLARGLRVVTDALADSSDSDLRTTLGIMRNAHLLIRESTKNGSSAWSCHPILRDHFRQAVLGWAPEIGSEAAAMLTGRPSMDRPTDVEEIEPVLAAIELLLDADDFVGANQLYIERLDDGSIFRQLGAPGDGLRCALGFVRDKERQARCEAAISRDAVSSYLNAVGVWARDTGEFGFAAPFFQGCNDLYREAHQTNRLSIGFVWPRPAISRT